MAALTRAIAATIIVSRLGPLMAAAEMAVTILGANTDLNDPFAWALRMVGHPTAAANMTTDAEMALMAEADYDDFLHLAEWRVLNNMLGAFDLVDLRVGDRDQKWAQLAKQVQAMLDRLEPVIEDLGVLTAPVTAGYISQDFREHNEARL